MTKLKLFLALSVVMLLTACGFHLRGDAQIADSLNPLYLQPGQLKAAQISQISRVLKQASANLTRQTESTNRLSVKLTSLKSRKIASSSLSDVELLRVGMRLEFNVTNQRHETLIADSISQTRDVELDTENVLAHDQRIDKALQQIQQSLLRSMIFQLSHL